MSNATVASKNFSISIGDTQIDKKSFLFFSSLLCIEKIQMKKKRRFDEKSFLQRIVLGLTEHTSSNFPFVMSVRDRCFEEKRVYIASKISSSRL